MHPTSIGRDARVWAVILAFTVSALPTVTIAIGLPSVDPADVNWDNHLSSSLPGTDGTVQALIVYNNKLIVGGGFSIAGNTDASCIAAWDGTTWSAMGTEALRGMNSNVSALTIFEGNLVAGGAFTQAGGANANGVAVWDGSSWSPLGTGLNGSVFALTVYNGQLIAAGNFRGAGATPCQRIAAWDGSSWTALGSGLDGDALVLTVHDGALIAGGHFMYAGDTSANFVASWDGSSWSPLGSGLDNIVTALAVHGGKLIAGGYFNHAGGIRAKSIAAWDGSGWSIVGAAMVVNGPVCSLAVEGENLIAVWQDYMNSGLCRMLSWNGASWTEMAGQIGGYVYAVSVFVGRLMVGGTFDTAGEIAAQFIAAWDGVRWSALGTGLNNAVCVLGVYDSMLVAGGYFTTAGGVHASKIATWDGHSWSDLGLLTDYDGGVLALATYHGQLIAGGEFIGAGAIMANHIAAWDGSEWSALGSGMGNQPAEVFALAVYKDRLIAGGRFQTAGGQPVSHLAAWDGVSWSPLGSGVSGEVRALIVYDGKLVVGGEFATAGGVASPGIAAWDGSTWSALGSGATGNWCTMGGEVRALAIYHNRLVAAGQFRTIGGVDASSIAAWNGSSWSPLGAGINNGQCGQVSTLAVYDDRLIAGGSFYNADEVYVIDIAAWDGSAWSAMGSGVSADVSASVCYNDALVVGGWFRQAGNKVAPYLASWIALPQPAVDILPGSCPNVLSIGSREIDVRNLRPGAASVGRPTVSVAILGAKAFDVTRVDPSTLTLAGIAPVEHRIADVSQAVEPHESGCDCNRLGGDGVPDLVLSFSQDALLAALSPYSDGEIKILTVGGRTKSGVPLFGSDCVTITTQPIRVGLLAGADEQIPSGLGDCYPNPFNAATTITFSLSSDEHVRLEVYNVLGQRVATLVDEMLPPGPYEAAWDARGSASGVYFARFTTRNESLTKKMVVMK
jgi:hypothetical protein